MWDDQHHDAGVPQRVARLARPAHAPLATELEGELRRRAPEQRGQRDDHDLAAGLRPDLVDDRLDLPLPLRLDDVREVVDPADGLRQARLRPGRRWPRGPPGEGCGEGQGHGVVPHGAALRSAPVPACLLHRVRRIVLRRPLLRLPCPGRMN